MGRVLRATFNTIPESSRRWNRHSEQTAEAAVPPPKPSNSHKVPNDSEREPSTDNANKSLSDAKRSHNNTINFASANLDFGPARRLVRWRLPLVFRISCPFVLSVPFVWMPTYVIVHYINTRRNTMKCVCGDWAKFGLIDRMINVSVRRLRFDVRFPFFVRLNGLRVGGKGQVKRTFMDIDYMRWNRLSIIFWKVLTNLKSMIQFYFMFLNRWFKNICFRPLDSINNIFKVAFY